MESVGELLARTHADLLISKQKLRQAEGIAIVLALQHGSNSPHEPDRGTGMK